MPYGSGKLLARWGMLEKDKETALFVAPHALTLDSHGDISVGEVAMTYAKIDRGPNTLRKFVRKS